MIKIKERKIISGISNSVHMLYEATKLTRVEFNIAKLRKLSCALVLALFVFNIQQSFAEDELHVDVYRSKQLTEQLVKQHIGEELQQSVNNFSIDDSAKHKKTAKAARKIMLDKLHKLGEFSLLNLSYVKYSDQKVFVTVDVVDKADDERLSHFLKPPKRHVAMPSILATHWKKYNKLGMTYLMHNKDWSPKSRCPAHHCFYPTDTKEMQIHSDVFVKQVPRYKNNLVNILANEKNPEKRENAAYLLAYIKDGKELVHLLTPYIYDPDDGVRNAVMRTLAFTLDHTEVEDFPVQSVVQALDFPLETDRNKALSILVPLAKNSHYAEYIKAHALPLILSQLKLKQPNLHTNAYVLLLTLSGKKFAENDYTAWQRWSEQQRSATRS